MKKHRNPGKKLQFLPLVLGLVTALALIIFGRLPQMTAHSPELTAVAQEIYTASNPNRTIPSTAISPSNSAARMVRRPDGATAQGISPSPSPSPSPAASPSPPTPAAPTTTTPAIQPRNYPGEALPLSDQPYQDAKKRFEIGIIQDYKVGSVGEAPLIESPDGSLAYTVVVKAQPTANPLTYDTLAQGALATFSQGEGFQSGPLQVVAQGEIEIPWTGTLTTGKKTKNVGGVIVAKQQENNVLFMLISATDDKGKENLPGAIKALTSTFKPLAAEKK
ncbi:MAG TPA: hypothetical protein IGS52_02045 [Oscillatoriaceae cyanobacterium M33_DOE_052]|uniref:Uncharacterized protein n=1 Tax=Planktothricoides sp. SpSt-374 TaxID=2282167 RepID=A0A7C3ZLA7_9CYAN|nr:hypothetical protein [Oscillatoriaceae cyanobacterium M33_DOE_052]